MPTMDYRKLLGLMKEKRLTQKALAENIGISEGQMCQKLAGKYLFKQSEIRAMCQVLNIAQTDIGVYFFSPKS